MLRGQFKFGAAAGRRQGVATHALRGWRLRLVRRRAGSRWVVLTADGSMLDESMSPTTTTCLPRWRAASAMMSLWLASSTTTTSKRVTRGSSCSNTRASGTIHTGTVLRAWVIAPPDRRAGRPLQTSTERKEFQRETVARLRAGGDGLIFFYDGSTLLGDDFDECTVDGTHPTNLGFLHMANGLEPVLRAILEGKGQV